MKMRLPSFTPWGLGCIILASISAHAALPPIPVLNHVVAPLPIATSPNGGNNTFQQLIDHANPSLGTFATRYWWNTTFWEGPGSPVLVFSPGEASAEYYTGFLTNRTIMGLYAQAIGGAVIVLEHRYWGESTPFKVLDTKNLTYLTLENSVHDLVHFARTVKLPFDGSGKSNAPASPWVFVGGSYSGALAAWVEKLSPGTFWAYHASSGPVQAIRDFWQYFQPIQEGMPRNCSADFVAITTHIDDVLERGNDSETRALREMFGLGSVTDPADFASAVGFTTAEWQYIQITSSYHSFYEMCDTIEGARPVVTDYDEGTEQFFTTPSNGTVPAGGVGVEKALINFAAWFKHEYLPGACKRYGYEEWSDPLSTGCYDSYNKTSPFYTDWAYTNSLNRQWFWMLCNEPFFYWQTGAPSNEPSLMSRFVTPEYFERQCKLMFPDQNGVKYGLANGKTAEALNDLTDGWFVNTTRLLWVNGEFDPWRSASVSSKFRPGGPQPSRRDTPVYLIPGARHCNDLDTRSGERNEQIKRAQVQGIAKMVEWVGEFYDSQKENGQARTVRS